MKRSELFFDAVRLPVDFLACFTAGFLAYWVRVSPLVRQVRPVLFEVDLPLREYLSLVVAVSLFTLVVFATLGLYTMKATLRTVEELSRIVAGISLALFGVIFWMFIRAELFNSRFILVAAWILAILLVTGGRIVIRRLQLQLLRRGRGVHRVILVGQAPVAAGLHSLFGKRPDLGYRVVAQLDHVQRDALERLEKEYGLDGVIRCVSDLTPEENRVLLDFCEDHKFDFLYIPDVYEARISNVVIRTLGGYPLVELRRTPLEGWGRIWKRLLDIAGAVVGLIILSPLFLVVAIAITADSAGPLFFRQTRIGRNRTSFQIVKFRTMVRNAEQLKPRLLPFNERSGPLFKMRNDPRITRVGRVLRVMRIDELPQLFNVLMGQMSLIGPRPHLPEEIERYDRRQQKLFAIKPGMSGLAQVSGSSSLPFEKEAALDVHYIENWSPKLDFLILVKTLRRLFGDRSAV
ncbi:MAG: Undecaprenyl-phosphate glucose phosphotransferase [Parcubacteria group bacterium Gr01-1014_38]|nr:MAG: Undecaprenyl-phosphate glucose phosphotransferase [Parcubacteria group bacterium Gr01-1014_38]